MYANHIESDSSCFVCMEPGGDHRCGCTLTVHPECLQRLLDTPHAHEGKCAVCDQPYRGVRSESHVSVACNLFVTLASILMILNLYGAFVCIWLTDPFFQNMSIGFLSTMPFQFLAYGMLICREWRERRSIVCVSKVTRLRWSVVNHASREWV